MVFLTSSMNYSTENAVASSPSLPEKHSSCDDTATPPRASKKPGNEHAYDPKGEKRRQWSLRQRFKSGHRWWQARRPQVEVTDQMASSDRTAALGAWKQKMKKFLPVAQRWKRRQEDLAPDPDCPPYPVSPPAKPEPSNRAARRILRAANRWVARSGQLLDRFLGARSPPPEPPAPPPPAAAEVTLLPVVRESETPIPQLVFLFPSCSAVITSSVIRVFHPGRIVYDSEGDIVDVTEDSAPYEVLHLHVRYFPLSLPPPRPLLSFVPLSASLLPRPPPSSLSLLTSPFRKRRRPFSCNGHRVGNRAVFSEDSLLEKRAAYTPTICPSLLPAPPPSRKIGRTEIHPWISRDNRVPFEGWHNVYKIDYLSHL
jgi:hypothetical protein